ncbi:MAG: glycoside hydrolase family 3 C-terminal domain-containing protein [Oscillospiraceae bacterium]|jgi:beta-glucosidase|nr:glycoside hydrolase family 3 C-terminal domain-containing protein [Oscillospiraceae bacterium]
MTLDNSWKDESLPYEERAANLVGQMTLEEKVSQMAYQSSALPRFGISEYNWWNECLHGVARAGTATMFPQTIGMAASFDVLKLKEVAQIIATEARIKHEAAAENDDHGIYKGLTMWTPNINIFRDPRWGRGHETYGEDPYLTSRFGVAFITGLQGSDDIYSAMQSTNQHTLKCVATAKHFAVHSGPEAIRHEFDVHPGKKDLYETYLPAFKAAVQEAGVYSVMGAYNRVYGESASGSAYLLQKILREEWGFNGYVVSDCGAVEDIFMHHKIVETAEEASALAVNNGCDLCCGFIYPHLQSAVTNGLISEETITKSAYRLILARMKLGMFDKETKYDGLPYMLLDCAAHHQTSLEMAQDSLVLLKNDGTLPLDSDSGARTEVARIRGTRKRSFREIKTIAVIGPNADNRASLYGNYNGTPSETYTVLEGLRERNPKIRYLYAEGCKLSGEPNESGWGEKATSRLAEAIKCAQTADAVIIVTGLTGETEGEEGYGSGDRESMDLPAPQRMLLDALASVNKPKVLVNMTGSATIFPHAETYSAIIQAWYPGQVGGLAVADVLFGNVSPSGRLPITFYASMSQVPDFTDYSMKGRTYRYFDGVPAYRFGYGLSYTKFEYGSLAVSRAEGGLLVTANVKNVGGVASKECAQAYISWVNPKYEAPNRQLAGFTKVFLKPGQSEKVTFFISDDQLKLFNDDGKQVEHGGAFDVHVGGGDEFVTIGYRD